MGYSTGQECVDEGYTSDVCKRYRDLPNKITVQFGVIDGVVAGGGNNTNATGQMKLGQSTQVNVELRNASTIQNIYEFNGTAGGGCTFKGTYRYLKATEPDPSNDIGGSQSAIFTSPGNFSMTYQGNGCPN